MVCTDLEFKNKKYMTIGWMKDLCQKNKLIIPEIRVWIHPVKNNDPQDYFKVFDSFKDAFNFIKKTKGAEDYPLLAINGLELNLFIDSKKKVK